MGVWGGPTKGRLFKVDFPSAKFLGQDFFGVGWVSEAKDPPPLINKACMSPVRDGDGIDEWHRENPLRLPPCLCLQTPGVCLSVGICVHMRARFFLLPRHALTDPPPDNEQQNTDKPT